MGVAKFHFGLKVSCRCHCYEGVWLGCRGKVTLRIAWLHCVRFFIPGVMLMVYDITSLQTFYKVC